MNLDKTATLTIFHKGSLVPTTEGLEFVKKPKVVAQVIPVSVEAWNYWSANKPSRTTMRQLPAKLNNHDLRIGHCMDIVADLTGNQYPEYEKDFLLEVIL